MLIVCPSCASEYALDPERIGDGGRKVRCATCRTTWFVHRPEPEVEAEHLPAVVRPGSTAGTFTQTIEGAPHLAGPTSAGSLLRRPGPPAQGSRDRVALAAVAFVLLALPSAIALRHQVVSQVPGSAPLFAAAGLSVNLVGLELASISAELGQDGNGRALVIEGEIRSVASRPVPVPRLEFAIEGKDRDGLYRWSVKPPVAELGPGESARFTARLASPPPAGTRFVAAFQSPRGDQSVALR
jgi:predicted Zn finger-like uncharacterized protein